MRFLEFDPQFGFSGEKYIEMLSFGPLSRIFYSVIIKSVLFRGLSPVF